MAPVKPAPQRRNTTAWWEGETAPTFYTFNPADMTLVASGLCDPSQLEPGVWIVPGHSTLVAPPSDAVPAKHAYVWSGEQWQATPDHRGEVRYFNGEFHRIISVGDPVADLGIPDMQVHDAQYLPLDGSTSDDARIRMWINDDVIDFDDVPTSVPRRVLAAWEAKGETIRAVDEPPTAYVAPEPEALIDKDAQSVVEGGTRLPATNEETTQ